MARPAARSRNAVIERALSAYALFSISEVRFIKALDAECLGRALSKGERLPADDELCGLFLHQAGHSGPARHFLRTAAAAGSRLAQRLLGDLYSLGLGRPSSKGLAIRVWSLAASQGCSASAYNLAAFLLTGTGCVRDEARAARTFRTLADSVDCRDSIYAFAYCARHGLGMEPNQHVALAMYRRGAELGCTDCQYMAGFFYQTGVITPPSLSLAIAWYSLAARGGDRQALAELYGLWAQVIARQASRGETERLLRTGA